MPITTQDILARFHAWLEEAKAHPHIIEPTAMSVATFSASGMPRVRTVLLKDADAKGFTFYTNHESDKGRELLAHPQCSLLFYWMPLKRQVRVEGRVEVVSDAEADTYFASRPKGSQIGAWASQQSRALDSKETLMQKVAEFEATFSGHDVPRPPHWSGFRLVPERFEFWQEGAFRLHDRDIYTPDGAISSTSGWLLSHTYP